MENAMQLDLGWNNRILSTTVYKMSPCLLKFHLNSIHDVTHTPANMSLWNMAETGHCSLSPHCSGVATSNTYWLFASLQFLSEQQAIQLEAR